MGTARDLFDARGMRRLAACRSGRVGAFTLIELLVVISIIALLISILLPSLTRARDQSKLTKCLAHMRGCGQAVFTFSTEHRGRFQIAADEVGIEAADSERRIYGYDWTYEGKGELLAWPVAIALGAGYDMQHNWDWGVRARNFREAETKLEERKDLSDFEMVTCPADLVEISTPFYPRNKGSGNDGLKADRDNATGMGYWGKLSFAINEDVAGVEAEESNGFPASGRFSTKGDRRWCRGETAYPPSSPCGGSNYGRRLRGLLDRAFDPATVGLIFEAGPKSEAQAATASVEDDLYANLITSALADGPFLSDFQRQFPARVSNNRHLDGRLNILFADGHGDTVRPTGYEDELIDGLRVPTGYAPNVRVSPYQAFAQLEE